MRRREGREERFGCIDKDCTGLDIIFDIAEGKAKKVSRELLLVCVCVCPFCPQNSLNLSGMDYKVLKAFHRDAGPF